MAVVYLHLEQRPSMLLIVLVFVAHIDYIYRQHIRYFIEFTSYYRDFVSHDRSVIPQRINYVYSTYNSPHSSYNN